MEEHADGSRSYVLPQELVPPHRVQGRVLTWEYVGQAKLAEGPLVAESRTFVHRTDAPTERDRLFRVERVDQYGRLWRVVDVDDEAWANAVADYDATHAEDWDTPQSHELLDPVPDLVEGTPVTWQPYNWNEWDCTNQVGGFETKVWEGQSQQPVVDTPNQDHSDRQKTAVRLLVNGVFACSAVLVGQKEVLTAAHCVSTANNTRINPNTVLVCRDDIDLNGTAADGCIGATDIDLAAGYTGGTDQCCGTDFADDWAVIELNSTWLNAGFSTAETMGLSAASDGVLANLTRTRNLSFPQFTGGGLCTNQNNTTLHFNNEVEPIAAIYNRKLRMKLDGSPGQSGSPVYYCPSGNDNECLSGQDGFVIAVFSGFNPVVNRFVGPKIPEHRTVILGLMND